MQQRKYEREGQKTQWVEEKEGGKSLLLTVSNPMTWLGLAWLLSDPIAASDLSKSQSDGLDRIVLDVLVLP